MVMCASTTATPRIRTVVVVNNSVEYAGHEELPVRGHSMADGGHDGVGAGSATRFRIPQYFHKPARDDEANG